MARQPIKPRRPPLPSRQTARLPMRPPIRTAPVRRPAPAPSRTSAVPRRRPPDRGFVPMPRPMPAYVPMPRDIPSYVPMMDEDLGPTTAHSRPRPVPQHRPRWEGVLDPTMLPPYLEEDGSYMQDGMVYDPDTGQMRPPMGQPRFNLSGDVMDALMALLMRRRPPRGVAQ